MFARLVVVIQIIPYTSNRPKIFGRFGEKNFRRIGGLNIDKDEIVVVRAEGEDYSFSKSELAVVARDIDEILKFQYRVGKYFKEIHFFVQILQLTPLQKAAHESYYKTLLIAL